jgi:hypothetical protein
LIDVALRSVLVLATSVWVGGLVTVAVVARIATRTLPPADRVALFRGLGRAHGIIGGLALLLAMGIGALLVADRPWSWLLTTAAVAAAALLVTTAVGVRQARHMTRLRSRSAACPADSQVEIDVHRGAVRAAVLRALIGVLSLTLVVLGVLLAG